MADKTPDTVIQEAYRLYISGQTLTSIAKAVKLTIQTLCRYKKDQNWVKRKKTNQARILQREDTVLIENAKKRKKRHEADYQLIQKTGREALSGGKDSKGKAIKKLKPKSAFTAATLIDMGIRGEREVTGDNVDGDNRNIIELTLKLPIDLLGKV